jgi:hypothetical protein
LLDVWESATAPVTDPNGRPLPNLAAMGADKDHKDLFVEIGYMRAARARPTAASRNLNTRICPTRSH